MVARKVAVLLKPNSLPEFTNLVEHEILPWLKKQKGFLDLIILAVPNTTEIATITFWDDKGNAQAYNSTGYPELLKLLEKLLDGKPYVKTFEVISSTFHGAGSAGC
jgi:hypothetical protein